MQILTQNSGLVLEWEFFLIASVFLAKILLEAAVPFLVQKYISPLYKLFFILCVILNCMYIVRTRINKNNNSL